MKHINLYILRHITLILAIMALGCTADNKKKEEQAIRAAIREMMAHYPSSTLQDIYKSCFQDHFGVAHLLADRERVKNYIEQETNSADTFPASYYEPCGWHGNFVRVNLRAIKEGRITSDKLTDAFIQSREYSSDSVTDAWRGKWQEIVSIVRTECPGLKNFKEDSAAISALLDNGKYVIHHSREYNKEHHPHYRIIHRSIFEREILPLLQ